MLAFIIINQCMYHSRSIFHSVILFHFRWRRKRETSASSSKATPPPFPSLPYPAILRRLLNKKKENPLSTLPRIKTEKYHYYYFGEKQRFLFVWVQLVECADTSCAARLRSQLLPTMRQHNLQAWVFSFPSRARGMNEWEREVWEDGEQFQFFLPEQQHYLTVFECARPTTHT